MRTLHFTEVSATDFNTHMLIFKNLNHGKLIKVKKISLNIDLNMASCFMAQSNQLIGTVVSEQVDDEQIRARKKIS